MLNWPCSRHILPLPVELLITFLCYNSYALHITMSQNTVQYIFSLEHCYDPMRHILACMYIFGQAHHVRQFEPDISIAKILAHRFHFPSIGSAAHKNNI